MSRGRGLAVRYRPGRFAEVVGQRNVVTALRAGVLSGRLSHQLLFSGGSGLGKTTLARVCAAALLCESEMSSRDDGDACGVCTSRVDITTPGHVHPDVVEMDAASHGGKDEVRELAERAMFAPLRGKAKVYIIDEAQGLTNQGAQALLRLIEEPPVHVYFMLATTDPHKMLPTIRGRCAEYELKRPGVGELVDNLVRVASGEGWTLDPAVAKGLVEYSDPALGVRGTLMALEKVSGALSAGEALSVEALGGLLGEAPAGGVAALWSALVAMDAKACFAALDDLRMVVPEEVVRSALVSAARTSLGVALETGVGLEEAAWRYRSLVGAAKGAAWTDVTLLTLLAPQVAWDAQAAAAMTERIEQAISRLDSQGAWRVSSASMEQAGTSSDPPGTDLSEVSSPEPQDEVAGDAVAGDAGGEALVTEERVTEVIVTVEPAPSMPIETAGDNDGDEAEIWGQVGVVASEAGSLPQAAALFESTDVPVVETSEVLDEQLEVERQNARSDEFVAEELPTHDTSALEFLEVAGERCDRMVVAALRSCKLAVDEDACVISGPELLIERLSAPGAYADLLETAADMGVSLTLVRT